MSVEVDPMLRDPILVTGSPRSGKTLTALIIARAAGLTHVSEPLSAWAIGATPRTDDCRGAEEATPEVISKIRQACARALGQAGGGRYVDDLAYHALRVPFVRRVMPDAAIVHVIQDAYVAIPGMVHGWTYREPMVRSLRRRWRGLNLQTLPRLAVRGIVNHWESKVKGRRRAWGPQPPGLAEFAREHHDPAEVAAMQWKGIVETALDDMAGLPPSEAVTIRFEDLMADAPAALGRLADSCRIADVASLEQGAREILDPTATHRWTPLSREQWDRVEQIVAPLRTRLGYTSDIAARFLKQE